VLPAIAAGFTETDDTDHMVLVLDRRLCGTLHPDSISMAGCLERQLEKADRWMGAVLLSFTLYVVEHSPDRGDRGDPAARLNESQAAFETYRDTSARVLDELASRPLQSALARLQLTLDRSRFLLSLCGRGDLPNRVDLGRSDWCQPR
jgi:hypothetical protein